VCELINRLLKDPNWRVRHASLSMLPFLAFILKTPDKFAEALPALQWGAVLGDSISMVRSEMVQVALQIASLPGFLHTGWAVKSLYAQCVEKGLFTSKDYHHRSALLKLLVARDPWDASVTYALSPQGTAHAQHASAHHGACAQHACAHDGAFAQHVRAHHGARPPRPAFPPPPRYPMPVDKDSKASFCTLLDEVLQAEWNEGVVEFKAVGKSLPAGGKAAGSGASSSSEGGGLLPLSANGMAEKIALAISASPDAGAELVKVDTKAAGLDLTAYYWEHGEYLKAGKVLHARVPH
jgi:hypothetical protein